MVDPLEYYQNRRVATEIAEFLHRRWAAIEGKNKFWIRWANGKPLCIEKPEDIVAVIRKYRMQGARSFYGTIEVFKQLSSRKDVEEAYEDNVESATVFIDIDVVREDAVPQVWRMVVKAASYIIEVLEEHGVVNSVYLVWSGAGMHVRVSEKAFNQAYNHAHPVDVAFAVAEYVLEKAHPNLVSVIRESNGLVKIENLVAVKRVFTAPLSLHRRLDRVAIALTPSELGDFELEWSLPEEPHHNPKAWRTWKLGEADELALEALEKIGRLRKRTLMEARATRIGVPLRHSVDVGQEASKLDRRIGRFQVMGLLQAARYYLLTGDLEKAKSWGLNRAIFYAWAKHYGPGRRIASQARRYSSGRKIADNELQWVEVGGERAQVSREGWFVIGGVEQRPEDFDRNIARRFEEAGVPFEKAWQAALKYLRKFPKSVLRDPQRFFHEVYEPIRDRFEELLGQKTRHKSEGSTLDKWFRKK